MQSSRRAFLNLAAAGIVTAASSRPSVLLGAGEGRISAVAFDAFPIFDPRPVFALAEDLFPRKGEALSSAWRTRQFEYQWLRTLAGRYADFWDTTQDALVFAAELTKVHLTPDKLDRLMRAYLELKAWPEVSAALQALRVAGIRLALLSNATRQILDAGISNSGLGDVFEHVLTTDIIKTYKPAPAAYRMAMDAFGLAREEVLFAAFAGWDAAGAKHFGYSTFWVNRLGLPGERLGAAPDGMGKDLGDLLTFMKVSAEKPTPRN